MTVLSLFPHSPHYFSNKKFHLKHIKTLLYLEHTVAVGIGNICLKPSKVGLVVMSEVKVLQPKLRVLQVDLPVALWYFDEWVINWQRKNSTF